MHSGIAFWNDGIVSAIHYHSKVKYRKSCNIVKYYCILNVYFYACKIILFTPIRNNYIMPILSFLLLSMFKTAFLLKFIFWIVWLIESFKGKLYFIYFNFFSNIKTL